MAQESPPTAKPPYFPLATVRTFLTKLRASGSPSRIDKSLMKDMSGTGQTYMMSCLRFFGLLDSKDSPTEDLKALIAATSAEEEKPIWRRLVDRGYKDIFDSGIDLNTATELQFYELLKEFYDYDGDTRRKCASFFASVAEAAGIPLGPHLKVKPRGPTPGSRVGKRRGPKKRDDGNGDNGGDPYNSIPPTPPARDMKEMLLNKFPEFNPAWPEEIQKQWFAGYGKLMDASLGGETAK